MKATVYRSTGSWYTAKAQDGTLWQCRIKGRLKIDEEITSTNPVAVGDEVMLEPEPESGEQPTAQITDICPRNNYMVRSSPHHRMQKHIVAANLDQVMLVATLREPRTSAGFIDRFLVTAAAYHIPAVIVFNKSDLHRRKEEEQAAEWQALYSSIGYPVLFTSAETGKGIAALQEILVNKSTLISGHSGVGKSTLINLLLPDLRLKTQSVSGWSGKGLHTTTFAEMFDLPGGGKLIDTPGIREFGIVDMEKAELSHYFVEMQPYLVHCQFNNCLHLNEPGCAVKRAVEEGKISVERYASYLKVLDSLSEPEW